MGYSSVYLIDNMNLTMLLVCGLYFTGLAAICMLHPFKRTPHVKQLYNRLRSWLVWGLALDLYMVWQLPLLVWIFVGLVGLDWNTGYTNVAINNFLTLVMALFVTAFPFWMSRKLYLERT